MHRTHRRPAAATRLPLLLFVISFLAGALAHDGFTVALSTSVSGGDAFVLNARATQPFVNWRQGPEPLQFSARLDLSYAVGRGLLPAVGAVAVLSGPQAGGAEGYLGVGAGVAFSGGGLADASAAVYGVGGVRLPIVAGLHAVLEAQLARARGVTVPGFSLGLDYSFGGGR